MGMGCTGGAIRQVKRGSLSDYTIAHGKGYVFNSLSYWKLMQLSQK